MSALTGSPCHCSVSSPVGFSAASDGAKAEYGRYLAIRKRELALPKEMLARWLGGRNVAVTGGTGCVGSILIKELVALHPRRVVSISRGVTDGWPRQPEAEYISTDVRDQATLEPIISELQPDVIFHFVLCNAIQALPNERSTARSQRTCWALGMSLVLPSEPGSR